MTALLIALGVNLALFVTSLIVGVAQDKDTNRYYQYLMKSDEKLAVHTSFDRAARRPMRILGTFIL